MSFSKSEGKSDVDRGDDFVQREVMHDHDVLGGGDVTHEQAMHWGELTPQEEVDAKKLRRKIDMLIMPLVMLV